MTKDRRERQGPRTRAVSRVPRLDFTTKFQVYHSAGELKSNEGVGAEQAPSGDQMLQLLQDNTRQVEVPKQVKAAMAKVESMGKEKYPRPMPVIKMNLKYKPMDHITKAPHYFKYVPSVYRDSLTFDFADKDYEIRERDKKFLRDLNEKIRLGNGSIACNANGALVKQEPLSENEFERFIDAMEKIYQRTKNKQDQVMLRHFFELADPAIARKVSEQFLTAHLIPYWKEGKRFTRKFWENPDANDPDVTAAFRKRLDAQPNMTLRKKEVVLRQKLQRKQQMREETVQYVVTKLLPSTWKREATKQALDRVHDQQFDRMYEAMLKEKNIPNAQKLPVMTREQLLPQKLINNYVVVKIALPKEEQVVIPQAQNAPRQKEQADVAIEEEPKQHQGPREPAHKKNQRHKKGNQQPAVIGQGTNIFEPSAKPSQQELPSQTEHDTSHTSGQTGKSRGSKGGPHSTYSSVAETVKREEHKSLEHAFCDMRSITKITQMLDLVKTSGCQIAPALLEQLLFYNRTDVHQKTMNQFEPSQAFADDKTATPLHRVGEHPTFDSEEDFNIELPVEDAESEANAVVEKPASNPQLLQQEFEQLAKRSYVVRRGRNNRLLVRPIMQMIFDEGPNSYELSHGLPGQNLLENTSCSERRIFGVGNNFYQKRYVSDILQKSQDQGESDRILGAAKGRPSESQQMNHDSDLMKYYARGRTHKRQRVSVMDLIFEEQPHLREYARQRALVGPNLKQRRIVKSLRKLDKIKLKQLCRESKFSSSHETFQKMLAQKNGGALNNGLGDKVAEQEGEDMRALAYSDDLPSDLVAQDFIMRGSRNTETQFDVDKKWATSRRAFLLQYCKDEGLSDYATMRALEKGSYLSDEQLLAMKPKIRPVQSSTMQALQMQMQGSAGGNIQDQSVASTNDDIFPATTSELQKEQITEKVQSLSNQFAIFKQQNSNTGIGGPRSSNINFVMGRGQRQVIDANDMSFCRQTNSNDTTFE